MDFIKHSNDESKVIGEFQGFSVPVSAVMLGKEPDISISMKGEATHSCQLISSFTANFKRMESALYRIDQKIDDVQQNINKLDMDYKNAEKIVNTPFSKQEELETKTVRLASLTNELNQAAIEAKKNAPKQERTCYFERAKLKKEAFQNNKSKEKTQKQEKKKEESL